MIEWFERTVVDTGRLPLFLCLVAFIVTFATTRGVTRMIRAGRGPFSNNVSSSGVHVHHAVPGVLLVSSGAFLAVGAGGAAVWAEIAGVMVGVGASLVLDEFALILRLDDVYWSEEGRLSIEMVALAIACLGLGLVGSNPFRIDGAEDVPVLVVGVIAIAVHLVFVAIAVVKGKYRMALLGTFVPSLSLIAAVRLARPGSRWARRYDDDKLARATVRAQRHDARFAPVGRRVADAVAGAPHVDDSSTEEHLH
ncbi:MAG: hypothetical protein AAGF73_17030 [Actinomycetota bacterium]